MEDIMIQGSGVGWRIYIAINGWENFREFRRIDNFK
jgi:hypothetical protein